MSATPIRLSVKDAVERALEFNLGLLLQEEAVKNAHGARWRALADLLPDFSAGFSAAGRSSTSRRTAFRPIRRSSARSTSSTRASTPRSRFSTFAPLNEARAASANERAQTLGVRTARDLVTLVAVNLYLEAVARRAASKPPHAQQDTADALYQQANDMKQAGVVAGIDVLRAQVQLQNQRQRTIRAENEFEKIEAAARARDRPAGRPGVHADRPHSVCSARRCDARERTEDAFESRADFLAARERLAAAEASRRAAEDDHIPTVHLDADYGVLGQTLSDAHPTFRVAATSAFRSSTPASRPPSASRPTRNSDAGRPSSKTSAAVSSSTSGPRCSICAPRGSSSKAAQTNVTLAGQELEQARDRFAAGVAGNIEVTQAQQSVAIATESYIDALYAHNLAKAIARARGRNSGTIGDGVFRRIRSRWIRRWRSRGNQPAGHNEGGRLGGRGRWIALIAAVVVVGVLIYVWRTAGQVSTDDAQIDGHITQVAARVGGHGHESQRRGESVRRGRHGARRARSARLSGRASSAPAPSWPTRRRMRPAPSPAFRRPRCRPRPACRRPRGGVEEAQAGVGIADRQVEAARAQLVGGAGAAAREGGHGRQGRARRGTLQGLVAKDEIAQQQYDAAVSAAESARASADAARSDVTRREAAVAVAEQRARRRAARRPRHRPALEASRTGPEQLRHEGPRRRRQRARQAVQGRAAQAELNLERTSIKAPRAGVVSRKSVEVGQVVQAGTAAFRARLRRKTSG